MLGCIVCVCVGFVRRGSVGVVNPLVRSPCKGCKEEGRRKGEYLGYLHDTGTNPVSVEQTLRVSSDDLKIIKPSNLMCFIETYREGITKISNKICSQKVTDSYESPKDTESARLSLPVCHVVGWP